MTTEPETGPLADPGDGPSIDPEAGPFAGEVSAEVVRLMRQLGSLKAQLGVHSRHGVEWSAYVLLFHLMQDGPMRSRELAGCVAADPSTVSRQAAALVDLGLVERRPDPADRRAVQLAATPRGADLFRQIRADRQALFDVVLSDWSPGDVAQLTCLLARFTTDIERHRPRLMQTLTSLESR
jgi:DNA-binding MarR family transcriptional regulator